MDEERCLETAAAAVPDERVRFWRRVGAASKGMLSFSMVIFLFRLIQIAIQHGKSEPGLLTRCLGMTALASFVIGTFLADLWVFHALVSGQRREQAYGTTRRINPVASLLLTGRLRSVATGGMEKDILSVKALFALFATIISILLLALLWTYK